MRGEDVREPPPGQYIPHTDPEEDHPMQTINIPAESVRCDDEIISGELAGRRLAWPVESAIVRGRNVIVAVDGNTHVYERAERLTVRRPV